MNNLGSYKNISTVLGAFPAIYKSGKTDALLYTEAAEAAGGTVESPSCVKASFDAFKAINLPMYAETQDYVTAAETAGGAVESFSCIRKDITTLNNIAL